MMQPARFRNASETDGAKLSVVVQKPLELLTQTDESYCTVSACDVLTTAFSIVTRIAGIGLNALLAFDYYRAGYTDYCIWTVCGIIVPGLITTMLGLFMYLEDTERRKRNRRHPCNALLCVVLVPFFCRYWHSVRYAFLCNRAHARGDMIAERRYYARLVQEDSDVALLRIFECLLEVAPQKILQLAIYLSGGYLTSLQLASIVSAMVSMAWCMASYYRCIRFSRPDKRHIAWCGTFIQVAWQFSVTSARVLAIAIVASIFPMYTVIACLAHACLMAIWVLFRDRSPFCSATIIHSFLFSFVLGVVFIFNYVPPREGRTRYRYLFYYIVCFLENATCVIIYVLFEHTSSNRHSQTMVIVLGALPEILFTLGILFMLMFYKTYHPNVTSHHHAQNNSTGESAVPASNKDATAS